MSGRAKSKAKSKPPVVAPVVAPEAPVEPVSLVRAESKEVLMRTVMTTNGNGTLGSANVRLAVGHELDACKVYTDHVAYDIGGAGSIDFYTTRLPDTFDVMTQRIPVEWPAGTTVVPSYEKPAKAGTMPDAGVDSWTLVDGPGFVVVCHGADEGWARVDQRGRILHGYLSDVHGVEREVFRIVLAVVSAGDAGRLLLHEPTIKSVGERSKLTLYVQAYDDAVTAAKAACSDYLGSTIYDESVRIQIVSRVSKLTSKLNAARAFVKDNPDTLAMVAGHEYETTILANLTA